MVRDPCAREGLIMELRGEGGDNVWDLVGQARYFTGTHRWPDNPIIIYEGAIGTRKKPDGTPATGGISADGESLGKDGKSLGAEIGLTMLTDDQIAR